MGEIGLTEEELLALTSFGEEQIGLTEDELLALTPTSEEEPELAKRPDFVDLSGEEGLEISKQWETQVLTELPEEEEEGFEIISDYGTLWRKL